ncbi:MAG: hypothetical protein AAF594_07545 [Bacteroidota bacterium]
MGQFSVLLVLAGLFTGTLVLLGAQRHTEAAETVTLEYTADFLAREAAQVGMNRVVGTLARSAGAWSSDVAAMNLAHGVSGVHHRGGHENAYEVTVARVTLGTPPAASGAPPCPATAPGALPSQVEVVARGTAAPLTGTETSYTIRAVYEQCYADIGIPPSLRYAAASEDDLTIEDPLRIIGNAHTNEDLEGDTTFSVSGTLSYSAPRPANAPEVDGRASQQPPVELPGVAFPPDGITLQQDGAFTIDQAANPGTAVADGWYGISGKGTVTNPYILFVNGDLAIAGDVRLPGHVRIYVTGDFSMGRDDRLSPLQPGVALIDPRRRSDADIESWVTTQMPEGGTIGVFVGGSVDVLEAPFVAAQIYAGQDLEYQGGPAGMVVGSLVARGRLRLAGRSTIFHTDASTSAYDPAHRTIQPDALALVSHREWAARSSDAEL